MYMHVYILVYIYACMYMHSIFTYVHVYICVYIYICTGRYFSLELRFMEKHTCRTLQQTETHCNTLQHTATHFNTLQHAATHCNTLQQNAVCTPTNQIPSHPAALVARCHVQRRPPPVCVCVCMCVCACVCVCVCVCVYT